MASHRTYFYWVLKMGLCKVLRWYVYLSVGSRNSKITWPNFIQIFVHVAWGEICYIEGRWSHRIIGGTYKKTEGLGDKVPQKLKLFVKLHIIFAFKTLKYNKQQLLLLLDKINLAAKYTLKRYFSLSTFQALKYTKYVINFHWGSGHSFLWSLESTKRHHRHQL